MKISTSIEPFDQMGDIKKVLFELKKAGFDAYDYSMFDGCKNLNIISDCNWDQKAYDIRKFADEVGISCNQSHAPFPTWLIGETEYNEMMFEKIIKALKITSILGGKVCVVHPCNNASASENAEFYHRLLPYAKAYNVKIGVENMWNWDGKPTKAACSHHDDFLAHMELLDKDWFVANVDIGHAEMQPLGTSAVAMLKTLNGYVQALHIHDNDLLHDSHAIPLMMKVDFKAVCEALKAINYQGDITLEVDIIRNMPAELGPNMMSFMASVANYLRGQVIGD